MVDIADFYRFRDQLVDELVTDLVGPAEGPDEVIDDPPLGRYICGVLWPADGRLQTGELSDPSSGEAEEGEVDDSPISQALMRYPTSMGLTFSIDLGRASTVQVQVAAARYRPVEIGKEGDEGVARRGGRRNAAGTVRWTREAIAPDPVTVDAAQTGVRKHQVVDGLELYVLCRAPRNNRVAVSIALRNTQRPPRDVGLRDAYAWFQVRLEIHSPERAIADRSTHGPLSDDGDLRSSALLYRSARVFGIGHGCAVTWDRDRQGSHTDRITSTFVPRQEVPRARPAGAGDGIDLRMSFLSRAGNAEIADHLGRLVADYRKWIDTVESTLGDPAVGLTSDLRDVADEHLARARRAADRIQAGIDLVVGDPVAGRAFRLMNAAMQMQRARQDWVRAGAKGPIDEGAQQSWRPFQIAFILLNLPGLAIPNHPDRDIADLLWFPTGGGKTEAYLGLVAFTILHRRLTRREATGVAVIMRYTLRLLTIQQFERATTLLCALERIRLRERDLGDDRLSIGLWVGQGATPNTLIEARRSLAKIANGEELNEKNPIQLTQCPWCGQELDETHYTVVRGPQPRLVVACGNTGCDFRDGLPVHVVDEDIYRERPALLLGTVDKFAQMAWRSEVRKLFARDGIGVPPSLIIQDELHLISGPLGSIVGLYETAVDAACGEVGAGGAVSDRPKIVASTATIRRADRQIRAVFDRHAEQFPPPGIDPDHSFFAEPAPRDELGTREYVGVMAPGSSHATLMVRVYAALLQAAHDLPATPEVRDPYWTLLGYFNSLRVLGGAALQVDSDVRDRMKLLASRKKSQVRELRPWEELTSRVPSADIPKRLKGLEKTVNSGAAYDVVLATNMISVGVDIDRLGLMTVMGQPQSSAEYIQATSRVGRRHPGLVVTIFNAARSRDRSHYENFIPYHQALYRAVEATSATPFAARARDRALHGVLVSLARLVVDELADDGAAGKAAAYASRLEDVAGVLAQRAWNVTDGDEAEETENQLRQLLRVWIDAADRSPELRYNDSSDGYRNSLLVPASDVIAHDAEVFSHETTPWPTLMSMRDVDAESSLYQVSGRRL